MADSFGIELERLFREAGVDASKVPSDTKLKDTGPLIGADFEADTARIAVAAILGIPYAGESAAPAPAVAPSEPTTSAIAPAASQPAPSAAVPVPAPSIATQTDPAKVAAPSAPAASSSSALVVPADFVLEGTMTIKDVAAALKTTDAAVIAKLELPAAISTTTPLRDMKDQYGYTMPTLKERFAK